MRNNKDGDESNKNRQVKRKPTTTDETVEDLIAKLEQKGKKVMLQDS